MHSAAGTLDSGCSVGQQGVSCNKVMLLGQMTCVAQGGERVWTGCLGEVQQDHHIAGSSSTAPQ